MRVVLTGGTGFIGGRVAERLRVRGDAVSALVRSRPRAGDLAALGCEVAEVDLTDPLALRPALAGAEAVVHVAGSYRIGIRESERPAMYAANVTATERVLDAAWEAGARRIVHVSTVNVFGDTHGAVVDEAYRRAPEDGYVSWYDETKHLAHLAAEGRAARGAPVVITQPGGVYGPGDHSEVDAQIRQMLAGKLRAVAFGDVGLAMVHVDDVAAGIVRALDEGEPGRAYVLAGECVRLAELIGRVAGLTGRRAPTRTIPTGLIRALAPIGPLIAPVAKLPPNLREVVSASDGVTYWATAARAERELGWSSRPLDEGLRATYPG